MPVPLRGRGTSVLAAALAFALLACGDDPTGPRAAEIVIEPATVTLRQKESHRILVSVTEEDGTLLSGVPVTFASTNESLATVSKLGDVTSVGPRGSTTIRVSAAGLVKEVPVVIEGVATSVVVTPAPVVLPQKGTLTLQAKVLDVVGAELPAQAFVFQSANPALVTVDGAGLLTSVGPHGVVKVDVRSGELTTTVDVAVTQVPTTLQVSPNPLVLGTGQTTLLRVRTLDAIGVEVATAEPPRFESSDASIVTVDAQGSVRSPGPLGEATITVRGGALSQTVPVTVSPFTHPAGEESGTITISGGAFGVAFTRTGTPYSVSATNGIHRLDLAAKTAALVAGAPNGLDLAISADGARAFVASQSQGRVGLVDLATGALTRSSAPLGDSPLTNLLSTDDGTLWVGTGSGVVVLDAATLAVQQTLSLGTVIHMTRHPSQPYVYASRNGGIVSEIDANTRTVRRSFTLGGRLQGVAVSLDGAELYVANEDGPVYVVDLASGTKVADIATGAGSYASGYGLALSPDGQRLYASLSGSRKLVVIDPRTRTVLQTIPLSGTPRRVALSPRGDVLLVAIEYSGVTIIR